MKISTHLIMVLTVITLVSCVTLKEEPSLYPSLFTQLSKEKNLELTLEMEADWQHLIDHKQSELTLPVTVSWQESGGIKQLAAEVSTRGHARRNICTFPPLRLRFSDEELDTKYFDLDYKTLKLVTHCIHDNEDLVLREYLIYKMLNVLTDHSFRVHFARVNYKCTQGITQAYAFIIENNEEMAERIGGEIVEGKTPNQSDMNIDYYHMMSVFQFMIGNTDWNMTKQHNIKLVHLPDHDMLFPVPYDFDYSGMVNAAYAIPPPKLPIKSVRERFFQWRSKDVAGLKETLAFFQEKKQALYDVIIKFEPLPMESRLDMLSYLDSFYENMPQKPGLISNN